MRFIYICVCIIITEKKKSLWTSEWAAVVRVRLTAETAGGAKTHYTLGYKPRKYNNLSAAL